MRMNIINILFYEDMYIFRILVVFLDVDMLHI